MSREKVEVVSRAYERYNRTTTDDLNTWLAEFFDPEIELHDAPVFPGAAMYRGLDAVRRHVEDYFEAWAESRIEIEEIGSVGDRVVARIRYDGVGLQSGTRTGGVPIGAVYDFRGGRVLRVRQFNDHAEALAAAGQRD